MGAAREPALDRFPLPEVLPMRNTLDQETSPYLLQHRDNPVHWQAWGPEALALARSEGKPILLSVGYAACHWCHVMAHESFENAEIAALMNAHFVNIKVDREERPDIDSIYQAALALMGQHGGWPLTMFLNADGEPFWGGTYFPPESRLGRPGFADVLEHIRTIYHDQQDKIAENTELLTDGLSKLSRPGEAEQHLELSLELINRMAESIAAQVDPLDGGLSGAPKFPQPTIFQMLWRAYLRTGEANYFNAVTLTLDRMCQGGIYDHLGGGFARYATDSHWLVPHFEKMLYDNALLIDLLTAVWQETGNPLYATRVRETIAWVEREMIAEGGAFAASLDADSEGEEGRYYVWSEGEIDALLGAEAGPFKKAYDVTPDGNWEGKTILNRTAGAPQSSEDTEATLARSRDILLAARESRVRPGWDDKVLTDWNGLMIAALANAGAVFDEPEWIALARRAYDFIIARMSEADRLLHSYRDGRARHQGVLDDYANMAGAALLLFEVSGDTALCAQAQAFVRIADDHFWDEVHSGYFYTADDAEALIVRTRTATDNAIPAGNGTMLAVLAKLYYLTGENAYRSRAEAILTAFADELPRNFPALATLINSFEFMSHGTQIVIVGERDDEAARVLVKTALSCAVPDRVLQVVSDAAALPAGHPAAGMTRIDGQATAYVCHGPTCSLPLVTTDDLRGALRTPRQDA